MRDEINKFIFGIAFLLMGWKPHLDGLEKQGINFRKPIDEL
ncbi:hypothetical protein DET65_4339 [Sunxiuqinia elliptica]|uniref:Uncharacterized protein n=1 Tax=Sunxiuqinia elliptica TaxID=655355 RepID=A0A4R6GN45_9BACT|nr:hypothetical protein DET52_11111 [Sunxiuqinia elliptica]TDO55800.1 hypothetical protein DET65_4339 [Sunxiuqinia elliptica]